MLSCHGPLVYTLYVTPKHQELELTTLSDHHTPIAKPDQASVNKILIQEEMHLVYSVNSNKFFISLSLHI